MDGSGAFPSGPQLSLEQFGGLFPLFGILFEVGLCDLLYEWPLPETRQDHQPILGAQLRGVCPYLGIRQVPREAIERGHTCSLGALAPQMRLGFWRGCAWGHVGRGVTDARCCWGLGRILVRGNTALATWGLRPAGPSPIQECELIQFPVH